MARGVHDIDVVIVPVDRRVLGQNGDAALLLQRVGIHDPLFHFLMRGKGAGLLQQLVHQGGLAVVDVGDDGDIAKFFDHEGGSLRVMANRALYGPNMTRPNRSPVRQRRAGAQPVGWRSGSSIHPARASALIREPWRRPRGLTLFALRDPVGITGIGQTIRGTGLLRQGFGMSNDSPALRRMPTFPNQAGPN